MLKHLSVLEQSVAVEGRSQADSIRDAIQLASLCEAWGYRRFWVSEHHSHPSIVGTAPEVLMAAIAATTKSIRIGSAGVMLPHYSTLKVAEQFRVLDALAPGRIDLGVGRAPGSDMRTAQLLNPDPRASDRFPEQIRDLDLWLHHEELPAGHPGKGVYAYPTGPTNPDLWVLGSSDYGAQVAAHFGLPYAFAHFITDGRGCKEAIELYRQRFVPSAHLEKPHALACVWALTAPTEEEAWHQFSSRARWKIDRNKGLLGALPAPDIAQSMLKEHEKFQLDQLSQQALVGSPESVAKKLKDLADDLELDEIVVITWAHDFKVRAESYRLLADVLL
jgi:luciferase family oxidoreductase group 1